MHRALRFATGAVILATAFLLSCHDQQNNPTAAPTNSASSSFKVKNGMSIPKGWIKDTTRKGLKKVGPDLPSCDTYDEFYWAPETKYRTVAGYTLGVWDAKGWGPSTMRDQYGFNGFLVDESNWEAYNNAINAGFTQSQIMLLLPPWATNYYWVYHASSHVSNHPGTVWYYAEEPIENPNGYYRGGDDAVEGMAEVIQTIGSSRQLFAGSYRPSAYPSYSVLCNSFNNFFTMISKYSYNIFEMSVDARWDWYYNNYGSHNVTNWLKPGMEWEDMQGMFNKAVGRGWNTLWCFFGGDDPSPVPFCEAACIFGWMQQRYVYVQVHYVCQSPNPCVTCEFGVSGDWYLDFIHEFDDVTEWI